MKFLLSFIIVLICSVYPKGLSQILPTQYQSHWENAGMKQVFSATNNILNILDFGADSTGVLSSDTALLNALNTQSSSIKEIYFPEGNYLFNQTIILGANTILKGEGSHKTNLKFALGGTDKHGILIKGNATNIISLITNSVFKGDSVLKIAIPDSFNIGDFIKIEFNDSSLVTDSWGLGTVGQIVEILAKSGNDIKISSLIRLNYNLSDNPRIRKINMIKNVGIECLKILRTDSTIDQTHNILFEFVENAFVKGIVSEKSNFAHIALLNSTNIEIKGSCFYDAFGFGEGGKAAGILCGNTSNECLIENNVFDHLRHSMLLQTGANANVFAYNYSIHPFWNQSPLPSNAAGDIVLHGNYPYANLFEGNIVQNIVIDNAHGRNGPYNCFFRNRSELYGIIMNNNPATDSIAFVGNEITNPNSPFGNYILFGAGHFQYGNNLNNVIKPNGTNNLIDTSYYLNNYPSFMTGYSLPSIGTPNLLNSKTIPSKERYLAGVLTTCGGLLPNPPVGFKTPDISPSKYCVFPNPSSGIIYISGKFNNRSQLNMKIWNELGQLVFEKSILPECGIFLNYLPDGMYIIGLTAQNGTIEFLKMILKK
ncbi:MAG TPA: glycosyl hydrolase family 28-related protein [Edaphocola sp.]|nr:glycosyl hydrolase family 28-related protein [Edaphocola sp.]